MCIFPRSKYTKNIDALFFRDISRAYPDASIVFMVKCSVCPSFLLSPTFEPHVRTSHHKGEQTHGSNRAFGSAGASEKKNNMCHQIIGHLSTKKRLVLVTRLFKKKKSLLPPRRAAGTKPSVASVPEGGGENKLQKSPCVLEAML
jgi:hypothetical protein